MTTHFFDVGSFRHDQYQDLSPSGTCVFCSNVCGPSVNLRSCTHLGFLEDACTKLTILMTQDIVICLLCHRMLMKCNEFKKQVEESIQRLSIESTYITSSTKFYNLKQSKPKTLYIEPDYVTDVTVERISSPAVPEIKCESPDTIKAELDSDDDNYLPLSEIKKEISAKSSNEKSTKNTKLKKKINSKSKNCKKVVCKPLVDSNVEPKKIKRKRSIVPFEEKYQGKIKRITLSTPTVLEEMEIERTKEEYQRMPFKCQECVKGFDMETDYNMHREKWHTRIRGNPQCSICKRYWTSTGSYAWHFSDHHIRYECTACETRFNSLTAVISHYNTSHGAIDPITTDGHACTQCGAAFTTLPAFRYHMTKHNGRPQCMECGKTFINEQGLKAHQQRAHTETNEPSYICNICGKKYKAKFNLKVHIASSHEYDSSNAPYCAKCNIVFKHGASLRNHLKTHSAHISDSDRKKHFKSHSAHISDSDRKFECSQCDRKFLLHRLLKEHIEWDHQGKARFNCEPCKKRFKTKRNMQRHMDDIHKKIPRPKTKICDLCGRAFGTARFLKIHMRVHTGERPLKCDLCTATFAHPGAHYKHKQLVHKVLPKKAQVAAQGTAQLG